MFEICDKGNVLPPSRLAFELVAPTIARSSTRGVGMLWIVLYSLREVVIFLTPPCGAAAQSRFNERANRSGRCDIA